MKKIIALLALTIAISAGAYGLAASVEAAAVTAQACHGSSYCE